MPSPLAVSQTINFLRAITWISIPSMQEVITVRVLQLKKESGCCQLHWRQLYCQLLCISAPWDRFSSYLRQPGPGRGSLHPGRSLFRELSLSYSGEMDLGWSLLGWGTKQGAHSHCPVSWELLNWSCVCSGDLNSTRGPLFCFFLSLW